MEKERLGYLDGPAISDAEGKMMSSSDIDDMLHEVLLEIYVEKRNLFPLDIKSKEEVEWHYKSFRTFHRTSDTLALEQCVKGPDIGIVHRWETVEHASGKRPNFKMKHHYAQFDLLLKPFLWYTGKM